MGHILLYYFHSLEIIPQILLAYKICSETEPGDTLCGQAAEAAKTHKLSFIVFRMFYIN